MIDLAITLTFVFVNYIERNSVNDISFVYIPGLLETNV